MFALNAVTFLTLKNIALALAIVNLVMLAAVLVCLLLFHTINRAKRQPEAQTRSFFDTPDNAEEEKPSRDSGETASGDRKTK